MENKMLREFHEHLDRIKETKTPFAIWGGGRSGRDAINNIKEYTKGAIRPEFIVDNNSALWGENGVISPKLFFENKMNEVYIIFVCVYVADEVLRQLREGGYKGQVMTVLLTVTESRYRDFIESNRNELEALADVFADERSIKTVETYIEVANTGDIGLWESVNGVSEDKTVDNSILNLSGNEVFVDIGAFTGDTIERFLEITGGSYKEIFAYEPEPANFKVLNEFCETHQRINAFEYAIGAVNGSVYFAADSSESGSVRQSGKYEVEQRKLDDIAEIKNVSFIKASTNGACVYVFEGAQEIIKRNRPKLSYYCAGSQMWLIPQVITKASDGYKFYLRHYGYGMQAMIGYAIPEEK